MKRQQAAKFTTDDFMSTITLLDEEEEAIEKGGKGSGNFGHVGRPGQVGGSGGGGGSAHAVSSSKGGLHDISSYSKDAKEISDAQVMAQANYSDISANMKKQLNAVADKSITPKFAQVKGPIGTNAAHDITHNMRQEADLYTNYLSSDSAVLLRDYINRTGGLLNDSKQFEGVDAKDMDAMMRDSVKKLVYQEVESNRQQFTDHGIRHIIGNVQRSRILMSEVDPNTTAKEKLMATMIMINHDVGYTAPLIREGGLRGVMLAGKHKNMSQKIFDEQKSMWNEGKIFSADEYARMGEIIKTHDATTIDFKGDKLGTATRLSDNLSLFSREKLPGMFRYVKGAEEHLIKMGEHAKNNDTAGFEQIRTQLWKDIDSAGINDGLKRDLKAATKEISYMSPKYTLGVLAGEISGIKRAKNMIDIKIQFNELDQKLQSMFDMGQKQAKNLLEAYGVKDYGKRHYKLGNNVWLTVVGYKGENKIFKGGKGSGNFGHTGRPGQIGGSGGGGSAHAIPNSAKIGSKEPITQTDKDLKDSMVSINDMIMSNGKPEGYTYGSHYDIVLSEGKFFEAQDLPKGIKRGAKKNCYMNAGRLALDNNQYTYCEGYGTTKRFNMPFGHAWCIDNKTGKVIDPTWDDGASYYGIPFKTDFLRKTILKTKTWGLIPEFPMKGYNPFKDGFPPDAIKHDLRIETKKSFEVDYSEIKGGKGSGNFGHTGRPGQVGGSGGGGGTAHAVRTAEPTTKSSNAEIAAHVKSVIDDRMKGALTDPKPLPKFNYTITCDVSRSDGNPPRRIAIDTEIHSKYFKKNPDGTPPTHGFSSTIDTETGIVHHAFYWLDDSVMKGHHLSGEHMKAVEALAAKFGCKTATLEASQEGRYVWPKLGFRCKSRKIYAQLVDAAKKKGITIKSDKELYLMQDLFRIFVPGKSGQEGLLWDDINMTKPVGKFLKYYHLFLLKHLSGKHDQQTHGRGGGSGEKEDAGAGLFDWTFGSADKRSVVYHGSVEVFAQSILKEGLHISEQGQFGKGTYGSLDFPIALSYAINRSGMELSLKDDTPIMMVLSDRSAWDKVYPTGTKSQGAKIAVAEKGIPPESIKEIALYKYKEVLPYMKKIIALKREHSEEDVMQFTKRVESIPQPKPYKVIKSTKAGIDVIYSAYVLEESEEKSGDFIGTVYNIDVEKGGKGSGNFGHVGRPGQVGGSGSGAGGAHAVRTEKPTSSSDFGGFASTGSGYGATIEAEAKRLYDENTIFHDTMKRYLKGIEVCKSGPTDFDDWEVACDKAKVDPVDTVAFYHDFYRHVRVKDGGTVNKTVSSVCDSPEGIIAHELAHHVYYFAPVLGKVNSKFTIATKLRSDWDDLYQKKGVNFWKSTLSVYSGTNASEGFSEACAAYLSKDKNKQNRLDKETSAFMDKYIGSNYKKKLLALVDAIEKGGKGSGNFGHVGRPGQVGGSGGSGGSAHAVPNELREGKTVDECKAILRETYNIGTVTFPTNIPDAKKIDILNAVNERLSIVRTQCNNKAFKNKLHLLSFVSGIIQGGSLPQEGLIGVYHDKYRNILVATNEVSAKGKIGRMVNKDDIADTVVHELGHHIHHTEFDAVGLRIGQNRSEGFYSVYRDLKESVVENKISYYAATNDREGFAESFRIWTTQNYKKGKLPKTVEEYFENNLRRK